MKQKNTRTKWIVAAALIGFSTVSMAAEIAAIAETATAGSAASTATVAPIDAVSDASAVGGARSAAQAHRNVAAAPHAPREVLPDAKPVDVQVSLEASGPLKVTQYGGKPLPATFNWRYDSRQRASGEPYGFARRSYRVVFKGDKTLADTGIYARVTVTPFKHRGTGEVIPVEIRIGPDVVATSGARSAVVHLPVTDPYASKSGIERTALYFTVLAPASKAWTPGEYAGKVTMQFSQQAADLARQP